MCASYYDGYKTLSSEDIETGIEIRWAGHYVCSQNYILERVHPRYFLVYILDGICHFKTSDNNIINLSKGHLIFYRPNESQFIKSDAEQPMTYCGACFSGFKIDELINNCQLKNVTYKEIGINNQLVVLFDEIIKEILINKHSLSVFGLLLRVLGEVETMLTQDLRSDSLDTSISIRLKQAVNYMTINYNKKITISEISAVTGYSVSRFQYLIQKYYGTSASEILINERIQKAKELLKESTIPISEIGYAVGFSDPYYFSKMFKNKIGISPREYRKYG